MASLLVDKLHRQPAACIPRSSAVIMFGQSSGKVCRDTGIEGTVAARHQVKIPADRTAPRRFVRTLGHLDAPLPGFEAPAS